MIIEKLSLIVYIYIYINIYSWFGTGDGAVFAHSKQKHKNTKCYNGKPLLNHKRNKIITRYKKWNDITFLRCTWNVQLFSPIGQALCNKAEGHHSLWKKRFYHYCRTQTSIDHWMDFQIIILSTTCLSRIQTLYKNEKNPLFKNINWIWINKLYKCLSELFDLSELKDALYNEINGHLIMDLQEILIKNSWFNNLDPESTLKRAPKLSRSEEDAIITALAMIVAKNDEDDDTFNKEIYVTDKLIKQIESITKLQNSYKFIQQFLLKIYKSIDEADDDEKDQLLDEADNNNNKNNNN